jgi:hypothetical protein
MPRTRRRGGARGSKGGKFKRNQFGIDWSEFEGFAEELDGLGADLQEIFTDIMQQTGETVQEDTTEAMDASNLPAKGQFSRQKTIKAIDKSPKVRWSGSLGDIGLGFDKSKPNAGSFLITGTPRMQPNYKLEDIFVRKKYSKGLTKDIMEFFMAELESIVGGK